MEIAPDNPDGLKMFPVTPLPLHVPPGVPVNNVFKLTGDAVEQMESGFGFQDAMGAYFKNQ